MSIYLKRSDIIAIILFFVLLILIWPLAFIGGIFYLLIRILMEVSKRNNTQDK